MKDVEALGYHASYHGQKAHYGVALLSRQAPVEARHGFPDDDPKAQRRFTSATYDSPMGEIHVLNGYFPQGENRDHPEKFPNKRKFYADLIDLLRTSYDPKQKLVVMGDFNISPEDKDIGIGEANAKRWLREGKCSFLPEEREWLTTLKDWGLYDSYRHLHPRVDDRFSWFDYRSRGFDRDPRRGLRIDYLLVTEPLLAHVKDAGIDYDIRGMEKPSDHAPVWLELAP